MHIPGESVSVTPSWVQVSNQLVGNLQEDNVYLTIGPKPYQSAQQPPCFLGTFDISTVLNSGAEKQNDITTAFRKAL